MHAERDHSKTRNVTYDYSSMKLSKPRLLGMPMMKSGGFVSSLADAALKNSASQPSSTFSIIEIMGEENEDQFTAMGTLQ